MSPSHECAGTEALYNPNGTTLDGTDFYNSFVNYWFARTYTAFRLVPGTYTVVNPLAGFHIIAGCSGIAHASMEMDFGGSTLVLAVSGFLAAPLSASLACNQTYPSILSSAQHGPALLLRASMQISCLLAPKCHSYA